LTSLLQANLIAPILQHEAPLLEHLPDPRAHFVQVKRLHQIVHRAERQAADRDIDVGDCRDHHHGRIRVTRPYFAEKREAVHPRHPHVGQNHRDRPLGQHRERRLGRRRLLARKAFALHETANRLAEKGFVVDHEAG
jgi:hypothetical protein